MTENNTSILIYCRDREFGIYLRNRFETAGANVRVVSGSDIGVQTARQFLPDCILLDTKCTEGEDGLLFLRRLRSFRDENDSVQMAVRKIPVIVLTSMDKNVRGLFEAEGIQAFFEKPYDPEKLNRVVFEGVRI